MTFRTVMSMASLARALPVADGSYTLASTTQGLDGQGGQGAGTLRRRRSQISGTGSTVGGDVRQPSEKPSRMREYSQPSSPQPQEDPMARTGDEKHSAYSIAT